MVGSPLPSLTSSLEVRQSVEPVQPLCSLATCRDLSSEYERLLNAFKLDPQTSFTLQ